MIHPSRAIHTASAAGLFICILAFALVIILMHVASMRSPSLRDSSDSHIGSLLRNRKECCAAHASVDPKGCWAQFDVHRRFPSSSLLHAVALASRAVLKCLDSFQSLLATPRLMKTKCHLCLRGNDTERNTKCYSAKKPNLRYHRPRPLVITHMKNRVSIPIS